jgi:hypothetical protein
LMKNIFQLACLVQRVKWIPVVTETSRGSIIVLDLKCGTEYELKVRAVNKDGDEGPFSPTLKMSTKMSLAIQHYLMKNLFQLACLVQRVFPCYQNLFLTFLAKVSGGVNL